MKNELHAAYWKRKLGDIVITLQNPVIANIHLEWTAWFYEAECFLNHSFSFFISVDWIAAIVAIPLIIYLRYS